jgi:hypothetical protein
MTELSCVIGVEGLAVDEEEEDSGVAAFLFWRLGGICWNVNNVQLLLR